MKFSVGRARLQGAPNSIARYRKRAAECRAAGARSPTEEERLLWLKLADKWLELLQEVTERAEHWSNLANPSPPASSPLDAISYDAKSPGTPANVRRWPDRSVRVLRGVKAA